MSIRARLSSPATRTATSSVNPTTSVRSVASMCPGFCVPVAGGSSRTMVIFWRRSASSAISKASSAERVTSSGLKSG